LSAEDLTNLLQRNPNLSNAEVAYLITAMQGIRDKLDSDESLELIVQASETRVRSLTVTVGATTKSERTRQRLATFVDACMIRHIDETPLSYPLIDTKNSFGGVTFYPKIDHVKADVRHGGGMVLDGVGYITIADHSTLKPTDAITTVGWYYLNKTAALQEMYKMQNSNPPYELRIKSDDALRARVRTDNAGGTSYNKDIVTGSWTDGQWNHIVTTWKGAPDNRLRVYINKIKQGSDVVTAGALQYVGTDGLGIGAQPDGSNKISNGSRMAWLSLLNFEADQAWIDDHFGGLLDTNDKNEITTYPFVADAEAQPEASFGIAR